MFRRIISRDGGCPWPATGMTSRLWLDVGTERVLITDLIATQDNLNIHALVPDTPPRGGDRYPHVIRWCGELYLEDGHHRAVRAAIVGHRYIHARVLNAGGKGSSWD